MAQTPIDKGRIPEATRDNGVAGREESAEVGRHMDQLFRGIIHESKLRSGRDDNRLTEDDIAKQRLGPRGVPGEPAQPNALPESETQIPKSLDPGHTA
jgi:hypothetical protein